MSVETVSSARLAGTSCENTINNHSRPEIMTKLLMGASHANRPGHLVRASVAVAHLLQALTGCVFTEALRRSSALCQLKQARLTSDPRSHSASLPIYPHTCKYTKVSLCDCKNFLFLAPLTQKQTKKPVFSPSAAHFVFLCLSGLFI